MILFMAFLFVKSWDCCSRAAAIENVHLLYVATAQTDCMKNIVVRDTCRSDFIDKENEESSTGVTDLMLQAKISAEEQNNWPGRPADAPGTQRQSSPEHRRGLLLIGLFKLSKAVLSVALGVGALKLLHHNIAAAVLHIADVLRIDPENHLIWLLLNKVDLVDPAELRHFSALTFIYAALCLVEGTGLMLEKRWAEYFTVTLTGLALPWECFELYKEFTVPRISLLLVNLAVLVYLIWLLRRQLKREREAVAS
jgi:uncharacterized membrane protein (DUF2068 family)